MVKTIIRRTINKRGEIHLPTSCIGKEIKIEYLLNGKLVTVTHFVKSKATSGYVRIVKSAAGTVAKIDISDIFSIEELKQRYSKGEYLTRTEQNILLENILDKNQDSTMGQHGQIPG